MTIKRDAAERFSLARWSRRKLQSAALGPGANVAAVPAVVPPHLTTAGTFAVKATAPVDLPPIESLVFDSDFAAFLRPEVDETLKRAALKQLFRDPRFNVMDGLDTYIDDYTKADPIPPDMLAGLLERFDRQNAPAAPVPDEPESASAHEPPVPAVASVAPAQVESCAPTDQDVGHDEPKAPDAVGAPAAAGEGLSATQPPRGIIEKAAVDAAPPS